jgi:magnesium transporter
MIKSLVLEDRKNLIENPSEERIKKFLSNRRNFIWMDFEKPTKKEYDLLSKIFNFHPLTIEDCKQPAEFPKIDQFEDYIFMIFHRIYSRPKNGSLETVEYNVYLGKNFIVTIHDEPSDNINRTFEKCKEHPKFFAKGVDFVLHEIIDKMVDKYFPLLIYWDERIEKLEDDIIDGRVEEALEKIIKLKRDISELKRGIGPQREVINRLARRDFPFISERAGIYFRDVYDHIMRTYSILDSYRDLLSGVFDAYLSTVSNKTNEVMKTLTVIATIFMPITFIASVYGMNFRFMPELYFPFAYFLVLLAMLIISIGMVIYFRRKEWL